MSEALSHITVLLDEAVSALNVRPAGCYVDGTFGRGGHSRLILQQLASAGQLLGFDKDPLAIATGLELHQQDPRFSIVQRSLPKWMRSYAASIAGCSGWCTAGSGCVFAAN